MLILVVFFSSLLLTGLIRYVAIRAEIIDVPNHRSSHVVPTPRGGGLSFVLVLLVYIVYSLVEYGLYPFVLASLFLVALLGFIDDLGHVSAKWRLLGHFLASSLLVYAVGGCPKIFLLGAEFELGLTGDLIAVVGVVWLLNLFNFMDGIDGIASVEVITSSSTAGVILFLLGSGFLYFDLLWLLIAAVSGFLVWNFPPAKIFMGDAGSGFLGMFLGGLILISSHHEPAMLWVWLIALGSFIVDSTYTLFRRLVCGEKVYEAHRSHAYQHAAIVYGNHKVVTLGTLLINLFWLTPIATFVAFSYVDGLLGLTLAYLPLFLLCIHFKAGREN